MSLKDQIFSSKDRKEELVEIPEWGCKILFIAVSGTQRDDIERRLIPDENNIDKTAGYINTRARLIVMCAHDPETRLPIFTSADIQAVGAKSGELLGRLFVICKRLSGMLDDIEDAAKK